jgi:hypothetical protein
MNRFSGPLCSALCSDSAPPNPGFLTMGVRASALGTSTPTASEAPLRKCNVGAPSLMYSPCQDAGGLNNYERDEPNH